MRRLRLRLAAIASAAALLSASHPATADPPLAAAPAPPPPAAPPMRSPPMVVAGGALVLGGVVGVAFGVLQITVLTLCPGTCPDPARKEKIGGAVLGVSLGALAAGVALVVVGARRPPAVAARALPAWAGEPGGAGWGWRF